MASETMYSQNSGDFGAQAEQEILQLLLQEEVTYCWNAADPDSEAYFVELEDKLCLDEWPGDEIQTRSHALFSTLDQLWPAEVPDIISQSTVSSQSIVTALSDRFGDRVPVLTLETIAKEAKELVSSNLSLAEKLVQCAGQIIDSWAREDLLVMARPLAYAMRGAQEQAMMESVIATVRSVPFAELTELEKARLSLAIARYAFDHLQTASDQ